MSNFVDILGKNIALSLGAISAKAGTDNPNVITAITGVRFTSQMLDAINGCTFIFDPDWCNKDLSTLPICFFFVKKNQDGMESKVTTKPMILFHEDKVNTKESRKAFTQIVADNIIAEPKTYNLDVLIPYSMSQILTSRAVTDTDMVSWVLSGQSKEMAGINKAASMVTTIVKAIIDMFDASASTVDMKSALTSTLNAISQKDYNKRSFEAMWRNRSLCLMKTWDGWNFKYVAITHANISKSPLDDNIYQGTITVQEVPILTMVGKSGILTAPNKEKEAKEKEASIKNEGYTKALINMSNFDTSALQYVPRM